MSSGFVCINFLKLLAEVFKLGKTHMKIINKFLDLLYHRHSWLSKLFYRTQTPSINLDKLQFLCFPVKFCSWGTVEKSIDFGNSSIFLD